jgi:SAM-dependent methyltransferase
VRDAIATYWSTFDVDMDRRSDGLMPWEQSVLADWVRRGDRVLLIGCGSGRELCAFVRHGCSVVGVEPSAEALDVARTRLSCGGDVTLIHAFVEDLDVPGDFDVCWFSYFSYSYIPDRRRRVALLAALSRRLRAGGRIVVTCVSRPDPPHSRAVRLGQAAGRAFRSDWQMAQGDMFLRDSPSFRRFHYQHVFTPGEIVAEAQEAALAVSASHPPEAFVLQRV